MANCDRIGCVFRFSDRDRLKSKSIQLFNPFYFLASRLLSNTGFLLGIKMCNCENKILDIKTHQKKDKKIRFQNATKQMIYTALNGVEYNKKVTTVFKIICTNCEKTLYCTSTMKKAKEIVDNFNGSDSNVLLV